MDAHLTPAAHLRRMRRMAWLDVALSGVNAGCLAASVHGLLYHGGLTWLWIAGAVVSAIAAVVAGIGARSLFRTAARCERLWRAAESTQCTVTVIDD